MKNREVSYTDFATGSSRRARVLLFFCGLIGWFLVANVSVVVTWLLFTNIGPHLPDCLGLPMFSFLFQGPALVTTCVTALAIAFGVAYRSRFGEAGLWLVWGVLLALVTNTVACYLQDLPFHLFNLTAFPAVVWIRSQLSWSWG